jgi:hypothetical protein
MTHPESTNVIPTKYVQVFQEAARCFEEFTLVLERMEQLEKQIGKCSPVLESLAIPEASPFTFSIAERLQFESFKRMLSQWPAVRARLRGLEQACDLPEPPCERPERERRLGVLPGMALADFDVFEDLKQLNAEFSWVKARATALEAAVRAEAA